MQALRKCLQLKVGRGELGFSAFQNCGCGAKSGCLFLASGLSARGGGGDPQQVPDSIHGNVLIYIK